jgi:hypothetical protein
MEGSPKYINVRASSIDDIYIFEEVTNISPGAKKCSPIGDVKCFGNVFF